ncbi:MAG: DNA starvation/stationary phase protection protein [Shinella sp.]|nr:MAG: DNA starvation/stationary phase protection protein [Shinella sp.]
MNQVEALRLALAETWAFYFKAHSFHWNVRGPLFPSLHEFFGDIYEDAHGAVDGLAEQLRALGQVAPVSLTEIVRGSKAKFLSKIPDCEMMVADLRDTNSLVVGALGAANAQARAAKNDGLCNYLEGRLDQHNKWAWQLGATAEMEEKEDDE